MNNILADIIKLTDVIPLVEDVVELVKDVVEEVEAPTPPSK